MCLAQGSQCSDALVRLEPAALRSRVKHSTTEPLHSPYLADVDAHKVNVDHQHCAQVCPTYQCYLGILLHLAVA